MITANEMNWNDREDQQEYTNMNVNTPEYDDLGGEDDELEDDGLEDDDELLDDEDDLAIGDEDLENDEFVEVDDDEDEDATDSFLNDNNDGPAYTNTLGDDIAFDRQYDESQGNGFDEDKDFEAHLAPESVDPDPNEIPEKEESEQEGSGYSPSREYNEPQEGNDASFSEQTDVTPPNQHEFPAEGSPKTDFESRNHGRTTGRMIGHEPGTEGI
ncbi:hypothetical protein EOD41_18635 [Mucilaginibacter limnophilus]|uniref:Uncharacterized protein n=1 Tax=Mucilaginibacter limnophilus TaxID=1932778 RepID=A0A437MKA6_9SPHI|nr:hypothetical protein [Mucilaginibacter limnophilus]RVT98104.1 hypothetical protein EOD41_18635 [Mucilaginibacter limnophilus]